jgi:glycosyltransferase involved in cell wall biosynthesis
VRIVYISPGAGGEYRCDNCLRDHALVLELRRQGHDALMVPLYLPMATEGVDASSGVPLFFGGINVYLQQKSALFRHTPRWLDRLFDSPRLLRWVARRAAMTKARDLGEATLSMLRGEDGRQVKELDRLVAWLAAEGRPQVICLSNALLVGLVRRIKAELGVPVLCLLQDEDAFLDAQPEPYRAEAWRTLAERAAEVDAFLAVSRHYTRLMRERLGLPRGRVHHVPLGIDTEGFAPAAAPPDPPVIGYAAPLCRSKGPDTLVEAFLMLRTEGRFPGLRLRLAGPTAADDRPLVESIRQRLAAAGAEADVEFLPGLDRGARQEFLRSLSVFSVPARQADASGVAAIEALAAGVPVVKTRVGAFPEIIEATGGGLLVDPDDAPALAAALREVLARPDEARAMGSRGRRAVLQQHDIRRMAADFLRVCAAVGVK